MEKILINSVADKNTKTGTPFKAVVFNHTQKATVWDMPIGEFLKENIGKYVMARVDVGDKFTNIREVQFGIPTQEAPKTTESQEFPQETKGSPIEQVMTQAANRNNSIIAQVFVKEATQLAINSLGTGYSNEELGEFLCMAVIELHGAYQVALDRLENG